ncbi:MAG: hypothetical protein KGJ84_05175 [Elusimicrobia bacterium]|nr:hypothetical protein [Elusimicrobiota bacterium]
MELPFLAARILLAAAAGLALARPAAAAPVASPAKPYVVIFYGKTIHTGICADDCGKDGCVPDGCATVFEIYFKQKGFDVRDVQPGESTPQLLAGAALYVVPGGDDVTSLQDAWTKEDREAIRRYIANGGRYLGSCLGGYWAGKEGTWPGTIPGFRALDLLPADVLELSASDKSDKVVGVHWDGQERQCYFQDGPSFKVTDPSRVLKTYATYDDNGYVATFMSSYGKGKVTVTGVHVEAPRQWYDDYHLKAPSELDRDLLDELVNDLFGAPSASAASGASPSDASIASGFVASESTDPFQEAVTRDARGQVSRVFDAYFDQIQAKRGLKKPAEDWLLDDYMLLHAQRVLVGRSNGEKPSGSMIHSSLGMDLPVEVLSLFRERLLRTFADRLSLPERSARALADAVEREAAGIDGADYDAYLKAVGRSAQDPKAAAAAAREAVRRLDRTSRIETRFDVPFVAGYDLKDPRRIFIDKDVPATLDVPRGRIPVQSLLNVHERVEKALLWNYGVEYQTAHQIALRCERRSAVAVGVDWKTYDDKMVDVINRIDKKPVTIVSDELDLLPYYSYSEAEDRDLIRRMKEKTAHDAGPGRPNGPRSR